MDKTEKNRATIMIPAKANVRYRGKSYKAGDEIPVADTDLDSLIADDVLDVEVLSASGVPTPAAQGLADDEAKDAIERLTAENISLQGVISNIQATHAHETAALQSALNAAQAEKAAAESEVKKLIKEKAAFEKATRAKK